MPTGQPGAHAAPQPIGPEPAEASSTDRAPLAGVRVLEWPHSVATRACGRLMAMLGAQVWQVGAPSTQGVGYGGAASEAYARWLDAGKTGCADLPQALAAAGADAAIDLLIAGPGAAEVQAAEAAQQLLAETARHMSAEAAQGTPTNKSAGLPPLLLALTWFAPDGPYARWQGSDALIQALSGVAYPTGALQGAPLLPRGHAPQTVAAATAAIAALAALLGRRRGWTGQRIDLDVLSANLCFYESTACTLALAGGQVQRRGVNRFTPTYPGGIFRTRDGWIGLTALTPPQWAGLCEMIGAPALGAEPRFQVALQRLDAADELDQVLVPALARRSSAEWLTEGQARRIPFAPVPSLAELPLTAHWQQRASFGPVPGWPGACGPMMPFALTRVAPHTPIAAPQAAPPSPPSTTSTPSPPADPALPLQGLRVLDLSMGWAGPLATRGLADLGAEVIKVESCSHVDWWRGFDAPTHSDPPDHELRPSFLMMNRHKQGITLDLKSPAGVALLQRLAGHCDVMVENYAPGVLDKLGVGARQLAEGVPGLVALSMGAFGHTGPWRSFRAYGSTVEQASGFPFVNGRAEDPPSMQHVAYGDPVAGLYGALACLAGLHARDREAQGAGTTADHSARASWWIDLSQVECLFQLCADALVAQSTREDLLPREGSRHPGSLLRCVVACPGAASGPPWLAVSVETPAQWQALAACVAGASATAHPRAAHSAAERSTASESADAADAIDQRTGPPDPKALQAMEDALAAWAGRMGHAARAADALQRAGVPAAPVQPAQALVDDPQCRALGSFVWLERRHIGRHHSTASPFRLDGRLLPVGAASPTLGQHNAAVLGGLLGLGDAALDDLAREGVIGERAVWSG